MHKTILIPTDFSVESLNLLKAAVPDHESNEVNILLVYGYSTSESITEMLFYSPSRIISKLSAPDFREAVSIVQNRLGSRITSLKILLFTGKTGKSFNSFLETNGVDEIVVPARNMLNPASGFDLLPFLSKSKAKKVFVEWDVRIIHPEEDRLAALFAL